jgi:ribosomal-protein-alanine N-acetyltransferase
MQVVPRVAIEPMREEDIPTIQAIEKDIFLTPWPKNAYHRELSQNRQASYLVMREGGEIVGYGGLWKVFHEAHVTTVGVRAGAQNKGWGRHPALRGVRLQGDRTAARLLHRQR